MRNRIAVLGACAMLALSGCAIRDERLSIADDLVVINFEDNRPKVRIATGSDYCKWRGKLNVELHYFVGIECRIYLPP